MADERRLSIEARATLRGDFPHDRAEQASALLAQLLRGALSVGMWEALVVQRDRILRLSLGHLTQPDQPLAEKALAKMLQSPETELVAQGFMGLIEGSDEGPALMLQVDWADGDWAWLHQRLAPREGESGWIPIVGLAGRSSSWEGDDRPDSFRSLHPEPAPPRARLRVEGGIRMLDAGTPLDPPLALAQHQLERWWGWLQRYQRPPQEAVFGFMERSEVIFPVAVVGLDDTALREELVAQITAFHDVRALTWLRFERIAGQLPRLVLRACSRTGWALAARPFEGTVEAPDPAPDLLQSGEGIPPWGDWWELQPGTGDLRSELSFGAARGWGEKPTMPEG